MIRSRIRRLMPLVLFCAAILAREAVAQFALGTSFSYQGSLRDGSGAAEGNFDFRFSLWDAPVAGAQIGPTLRHDSTGAGTVAVTGGLFNVVLDFGADAFIGEARWLQISVRNEDPSGSTPFTTLNPRVELLAVPNALHARGAGTLDGMDSTDFLEKDGRAFVIVRTTDDPVLNGANLLTAYEQARTLAPHGLPLSADNRATVLVPPGHYDLGTGQLVLDTEFTSLIGLSSNRRDQFIYGESAGDGTGVLRQTASDVVIENLRIRLTRSTGSPTIGHNSFAAYFPDTNLPETVIRNCAFEQHSNGDLSTRFSRPESG